MRILLIEEDTQLRHLIGRMLGRAGYQVIEAASGADGLRLWHTERTHLVVTDILMAGTSGIEVIFELRTFAPALPIIAVIGEDMFGALERLQEAQLLGQVGLLRKPFSHAELLAVVEAAFSAKPPIDGTRTA